MSAALKTGEPLSPEAVAFITGGRPEEQTPKASVSPVKLAEVESSVVTQPPEPKREHSLASAVKTVKSKSVQTRNDPLPSNETVSLTSRIPGETHTALLKASFDRKLNRVSPWTQQEILDEALTAWLKKEGYL